MPSPAKLNDCNHTEEPERVLLQCLGWTYVPRSVKTPALGALLTG